MPDPDDRRRRRPRGGRRVELALAADNRIATARSTFQLPFGALGLSPTASRCAG
ncbi:hypothetical protein BZL29_5328 [Mycobacterium kansasii]|uniref:Uncharacterized protein n=1 Tax=Mycobacterium kansasii TaxID=1768 RepID=A0A1V3X1Q8_MYCKA|nr:hypothetical protein BZL29_5328 [Mycobacterium kansasii]